MSLPERLDPNIWGAEAAQSREVRAAEADIGQTGASAASSAASAARTAGQAVTEEQTRGSVVSKAQSDAELAALRVEAQRRTMERLERNQRPASQAQINAQRTLRNQLERLVTARQLIQDRSLATGFGSTTLAEFGGTSAAEVDSLLAPIRATNGFDAVNKMRAESPTGVGLGGNTSDTDLRMLQASEGAFDLKRNDDALIGEIDYAIEARLINGGNIGISPYVMAEILGPSLVEQFAPSLRAWRPSPGDEQVILDYVNRTRADNTFDPTDYATLMAQAYERATGERADEGFVGAALDTAYELQGGTEPLEGLGYDVADSSVRELAVQRVSAQEPDTLSAGDVAVGALENFIPSTLNMAVDTVRALTIDAPETLEGIIGVIGGATGLSEDTETWDAVRDYYVGRYGSAEGFKRALMTDPAGILADIAGIATLGGTTVAKTLGTVGRVTRIGQLANAARKAEGFTAAASALDPLAIAGRTTAGAANLAGKVASATATGVPAGIAGVPTAVVRRAVDAGRRGSTEFTDYLTGSGDANNIVNQLKTSVSELFAQRSADYQLARSQLNLNETVPFALIDDALIRTETMGRFRDVPPTRRAPEAWTKARDLVNEFRTRGYNDVESVDAMKQQLGELRDSYAYGTPEHRVVSDIYNGVRGAITEAAPQYANMMQDYSTASAALDDVIATLATNSASPDVVLGKLRRQIGGNTPRGTTVIDLLEGTQSGAGISDRVAGLALASDDPSRFANLGSTGAGAIGLATGNPAAAIPATMVNSITPRGVGQFAYDTGRRANAVSEFGRRIADAPVIGGQSIADMATKYLAPVATYGPSALRVANPAIIQPLVDPYEAPQPSAALSGEPVTPYADMLPSFIRGGSGISLDALADRYGASSGPEVSLDNLARQYEGAPDQRSPSTAQTGVVTIGGRPAVYDEMTDSYLDVETGEVLGEGAPAQYARGGRVRTAMVPNPVPSMYRKGGRVTRKRPVPTRALKG